MKEKTHVKMINIEKALPNHVSEVVVKVKSGHQKMG